MRLNRQTLFFLIACLAVIIAGVAISNLQQQQSEADTAATAAAATMFSDIIVTDVARLSVTDETTAAATVYIQQADGAWGIESTTTGGSGDLSGSTVDTAIADLLRLKSESFPAEDISVFGLDVPELTVIFTTKDGKAQTLRVGSKNPQQNAHYALLNDDAATVYLVSPVGSITRVKDLANTPPFATPPTPSATNLTMPGPVLANVNMAEVTRIELRNNTTDEFLVLQRDAAGTWGIGDATHSKEAAAEPMLINVLTGGLTSLSGVDGFESEDLAAYGLDDPVYTFTLTTSTGETKLDVGSTERNGTRTNAKVSGFTTIVVLRTDDLQPFLDAIASPPYVVTAEATDSAAATAEATDSAAATAEATEDSD